MDFQKIIDEKDVSENTKRTYKSILARVTREGFKIPVGKTAMIPKLKEYLFTYYDKTSAQLAVINIILILRKALKLQVDDLIEFRDRLRGERVKENVQTMSEVKVMPVADYKEELQKLFTEKKYKAYIINYLMFHYGVRNQDVITEIVKTKKQMGDGNYLWLRRKDILYVRKDYKTHSTYGTQQQSITSKEFRKAVLKTKEMGFTEKQVGNQLKPLILLKESDVFKMLIDDAYHRKDIDEINRLAKSRGTDVTTIKENYNLNAKDDMFRKI